MTRGPIIIVDDDDDDVEIYTEGIRTLGITNQIRHFNTCQAALDYLLTTSEQPFIILSDVNMPLMTGLEFKAQIQQDDFLRQKGIPFIFISTNADKVAVRAAHHLSVQGYFQKPVKMEEIIS